jgi:hypothetical protein
MSQELPRTPPRETTPYKLDTAPLPLDLYSEYGGMHGCWYRVPSWRVHFDCEALKGVDVRMHRGIGSSAVWTLTEATTGFKMFGDIPHDYYVGDEGSMLSEFAAGMMLKLTPDYVAKAIAKAREVLKGKPPSPFVPSESGERVTATLAFDTPYHRAEVRKHWECLVQKYADMPFRTDTSQPIANVTNDAINLAKGAKAPPSASREHKALDLLQQAADGLYNVFEPDNQSALWLRVNAFLNSEAKDG